MARVRVEVAFDNPVVFAGEDLSAIVTFRNVGTAATAETATFGHARTSSVFERSGLQRSGSVRNSYAPQRNGSISNNNNNNNNSSRSSFSMSRPSFSDEGLLMGYVQVQGYFQVDDTLINPRAFDTARKHGVIVGKNGELGYGATSGGFLKGLTSGLGNLLKVQEDPASSSLEIGHESVPIFSTPQSLLFVDLKLEPGQSKSFAYTIKLPTTIPPSCRAKSIRISYNLVIGTQKLDYRGRPQPKTISVPFRVFPHVDHLGLQPVHLLDEPIVLKRDEATVTPVNEHHRKHSVGTILKTARKTHEKTHEEQEQDFQTYVSNLLDEQTRASLLNPTRTSISAALPEAQHDSKCRTNIDHFVRYYDQLLPPDAASQFKSRFELGRGGNRIAAAALSKAVYRVGEEVLLQLDFANAKIKCHHVTASLETTESITDMSIAQTTHTEFDSVQRATRRVFAQLSSSTFEMQKTHFTLVIPASATPQFATSGVAMRWSIRLEFVVSSTRHREQQLLKLDSALDTNGQVSYAVRRLDCETVTCQIPLNVYPTNQDVGALVDHAPRRWFI